MNAIFDDEHVPVRRCDIEPAWLQLLVVNGVHSRERSRTAEYVRQRAHAVGGKVMNHQDGSRQVAREGRGKPYHGLDPSGGESNYHYVTTRHAGAFRERYQDCTVGLV
jgi:hypothetical protein